MSRRDRLACPGPFRRDGQQVRPHMCAWRNGQHVALYPTADVVVIP